MLTSPASQQGSRALAFCGERVLVSTVRYGWALNQINIRNNPWPWHEVEGSTGCENRARGGCRHPRTPEQNRVDIIASYYIMKHRISQINQTILNSEAIRLCRFLQYSMSFLHSMSKSDVLDIVDYKTLAFDECHVLVTDWRNVNLRRHFPGGGTFSSIIFAISHRHIDKPGRMDVEMWESNIPNDQSLALKTTWKLRICKTCNKTLIGSYRSWRGRLGWFRKGEISPSAWVLRWRIGMWMGFEG